MNYRTNTLVLIAAAMLIAEVVMAQPGDRIRFNEQDIFLSGGNVAWIDFAQDIGPGETRFDVFRQAFEDVRDNGGNAFRFWLHINGSSTPEWNGSQLVGPGPGTIEDLRAILDLARENNVGLLLCLWSFDMLRVDQIAPEVLSRNEQLLRSPELTQDYIDKVLIPMVKAVGDHPAVIAWEIFNEPEGMSEELGWDFNRHVPMSDIQRFINQLAGAIHRTNANAQVTNGSWAFIASSDITHEASSKTASQLSEAELEKIRVDLERQYGGTITSANAASVYNSLHSATNFNYYRDDRLIGAGGDADGTLDFFTVHYYVWADTPLSPFHHDYDSWALNKPMAIGEFFLPLDTYGVPPDSLYKVLIDRGYAGALAWQWIDWYTERRPERSNWPRARRNMQLIRSRFPADVVLSRSLEIARFDADRSSIETGQTTELSWVVYGSVAVSLNGMPVDSIATLEIAPAADTTYVLVAQGSGGEIVSDTLSIKVTDPTLVNRALGRPATSASGNPGFAVDGDLDTSWSDSTTDDGSMYVEFDDTYRIERVKLLWGEGFATSYDIEVSLDGVFWTTIYEEQVGDGSEDEVLLDPAPIARFLRLQGNAAANEQGYVVRELEAYGLVSEARPPQVFLVFPYESAIASPTSVTLEAVASDEDGEVTDVSFFAGEELLGTVTNQPYALKVDDPPPGEFSITAVARDNDALVVSTEARTLFVVSEEGYTRYEYEDAALEGDILIESSPLASGNQYVYMRASGTMRFDSVYAEVGGEYIVTARYRLPHGFKAQFLSVNAGDSVEIGFDGPTGSWLRRGLKMNLTEGYNRVVIEDSWGWMHFDYMGVDAPGQPVARENESIPQSFSVGQSYPNPFSGATTIPYSLPEPTRVRIELFDVAGEHVATLVRGLQPAGRHNVTVSAQELASGVYFYHVQAGNQRQIGRLTVVK